MNKEDILIALKEIHARYCIPASEQNYTDKDYACMQYEKLVIHLSNQLDKQKEVLDKIKEDIEFCINNLKNEYACTDKRTNRELHTTVKILKELLEEIE